MISDILVVPENTRGEDIITGDIHGFRPLDDMNCGGLDLCSELDRISNLEYYLPDLFCGYVRVEVKQGVRQVGSAFKLYPTKGTRSA